MGRSNEAASTICHFAFKSDVVELAFQRVYGTNEQIEKHSKAMKAAPYLEFAESSKTEVHRLLNMSVVC